MNKHTPGPWTQRQAFTSGEPVEKVIQCGTEVLASVYDLGRNRRNEMEENARLIAAAPELLEALEYVVQWHREHDSGEGELFGLDFVTTCIAAISKAKGGE